MRIGELSRATGVPVPTIKYYVREGLLPPGELTSPNQAHYGDAHADRLRLIRALLDVGGLSVAAIGKVLAAVEDTGGPLHSLLGAAAHSVCPRYPEEPVRDHLDDAAEVARELIGRRGWRVPADHPAVAALTAAVAAFLALGHDDYLDFLDEFAGASEQIAAADLDYVLRRRERGDLVERVVVGTVLGDALLGALRRLAQADNSARRFNAVPPPAP
ncbi:MerR family transcriptional regulator [Streptomyces sp. NPDC089919]|uniref:MerR family transcriptional regulator n=1 Tax=Streptomyces sp. NPDC089919 TaxID=3155188 RepID=UPI003424903F